jgi:hypothetical protein
VSGRRDGRRALGLLRLLEDSIGLRVDADLDPQDPDSQSLIRKMARGEANVPRKPSTKVSVKYKSEALPGSAELQKLDKLLPHVNYVESGVGGKPTIQFSGVNVQVVNGEGKMPQSTARATL